MRKKLIYQLSDSKNLSDTERLAFKFMRYKTIIEDAKFDELSYFKSLKDKILRASIEDTMMVLVKLLQLTL